MTKLSVNLNKIALLRNSRGRDFPNVVDFAKKFIDLGAEGITIHPRQDERHITQQDAVDLGDLLSTYSDVEFNIEGYPSREFLDLIAKVKPTQCTLVPDSPEQLTSDHGWDLLKDGDFVKDVCSLLLDLDVRAAIFLDPDIDQIRLAPETRTKRVELYTETYAASFQNRNSAKIFKQFNQASVEAQKLGLGVNAGHDLDLLNLPKFLEIKNILEVSIGHVLTVECIEQGMKKVVDRYLNICKQSA